MTLLSEASVGNAKPRDRAYKLFDERGLFLLVKPNGARLWRLRYRIGALEKLISLGIYPDVPLKRAREKQVSGVVVRSKDDGTFPNSFISMDHMAAVVTASVKTL